MNLIRDMFWSETVASSSFAIFFLIAIVLSMGSLERICRQLNLLLPAGRKVTLHPPLPRSFGQLIGKTNLLSHSLELLEQHRKYYPSSFLRKSYGIALVTGVSSLIGFLPSSR